MANFVSNKNLLSEIIVSQCTNQITDDCALIILKMIDKYATKPNFCGYSYIDEMKSEATVHCLKAVMKFDISRDNPFSYLTTTIHNAFLIVLKKEKRQQQLRDKMLIINGLEPSVNYKAA